MQVLELIDPEFYIWVRVKLVQLQLNQNSLGEPTIWYISVYSIAPLPTLATLARVCVKSILKQSGIRMRKNLTGICPKLEKENA